MAKSRTNRTRPKREMLCKRSEEPRRPASTADGKNTESSRLNPKTLKNGSMRQGCCSESEKAMCDASKTEVHLAEHAKLRKNADGAKLATSSTDEGPPGKAKALTEVQKAARAEFRANGKKSKLAKFKMSMEEFVRLKDCGDRVEASIASPKVDAKSSRCAMERNNKRRSI